MKVVYGHGQSYIWGGSRGIGPLRMLDRKWRDRKMPFGSMLCAWATGSSAISALLGPFSPEVTVTWPEETLSGLTFFPSFFFPTFFPVLFFSTFYFPYFFPYIFSRTYFLCTLFPYLFPVLLFPVLFFPTFFPYFFFMYFFPYFFKSRDVWNPTF